MGSIVFVAGARPNFVKIAPILRALAKRAGSPPVELVHTGQHYDVEMSDVFFDQLAIRPPDIRLEVGSGHHGEQTGRIMAALEAHLESRAERPRGVVVVGDVNSTMAGALVAVKLGIRTAHVEAGLRSFDRTMPEEINRVVTDAIADLLLVSEPAGLVNLEREGIPKTRIRYCGNVMIDSLVEQLSAARALATASSLGLRPRSYAVVTIHRPSNVDHDRRLADLVGFVCTLAEELDVVFPAHPRTARRLAATGLDKELAAHSRVRLLPPFGYREFLSLVDTARLVVSDSGGVQEETTYLGVPCITMRTTTERPITTTHGTNRLVGEDLALARTVATQLLTDAPTSQPIDGWDGHAAERVADCLLEAWS